MLVYLKLRLDFQDTACLVRVRLYQGNHSRLLKITIEQDAQ
jgi:hypothetical protein